MGSTNLAVFDPDTEQFSTVMMDHGGQTGMQVDAEARLWKTFSYHDSDGHGLVYVDTISLAIGEAYDFADYGLGHITHPKGVSIDHHGKVWANSYSANAAVRFDPDGLSMDSYEELDHPYTYSDMTGWGLQNAACDPAG
jgi:streptogramin lyase